MCFIGNSRLQGELKTVEELCVQQELEAEEIHRSRSEEVVRLTLEAAALQRQLLGQDACEDLLACGGARRPPLAEGIRCPARVGAADTGRGALGGGSAATADADTSEEEVEALQKQLDLQRKEHEEAKRRLAEAHERAALLGARLAVLRESHAQEVQALRQRLAQQPPPTALAEVDGAACHAAEVAHAEMDIIQLRRCCEVLREPAERLLAVLGQPPLVATDTVSAGGLATWLEALARRLDVLAAAEAAPEAA